MKICDFCHRSHFSGFDCETRVFQCYLLKCYKNIFTFFSYILTEFIQNALCCAKVGKNWLSCWKDDKICLFYQICFNTLIACFQLFCVYIFKNVCFFFIIESPQKIRVKKIYIYIPVVCTKKFITSINSLILNSALRN